VLLVFGAPCQLRLLAGPEHSRTIPLADKDSAEISQRSSASIEQSLTRCALSQLFDDFFLVVQPAPCVAVAFWQQLQ
jgi:hypothetical protein